MFLLGRRSKDEEVRRLEHQLKEVQSDNRVLVARVKRLEVQHDVLEQENLSLKQAAAKQPQQWVLDSIADAAVQSQRVREENEGLRRALKTQAGAFEQKLEVFKGRTKQLLTTLITSGKTAIQRIGSSQGVAGLSEGSVQQEAHEALQAPTVDPEAMTATLAFDDPSVHASVLNIVACLYDDSLSEDEAVERLAQLKCSLTLNLAPAAGGQHARVASASKDTDSLADDLGEEDIEEQPRGASAADASTSPFLRERSDATTATDFEPSAASLLPAASDAAAPADGDADMAASGGKAQAGEEGQEALEGAGADNTACAAGLTDKSAEASEATTPRVVPALNLAALSALNVAANNKQHADEAAALPSSPGAQSTHSFASLRSNASFANVEPFLYLSQFVLAQPDKLQRLITRANSLRQKQQVGVTANMQHTRMAQPPLHLPNIHMPNMMSTGQQAGSNNSVSGGPIQPRLPGTRMLPGFGTSHAGSAAPALPANDTAKAVPAPPSMAGMVAASLHDDTRPATDRPPRMPKATGAPKIGLPSPGTLGGNGVVKTLPGAGGRSGDIPAAASGSGMFKSLASFVGDRSSGDQQQATRQPKFGAMGAMVGGDLSASSTDDDGLMTRTLTLARK